VPKQFHRQTVSKLVRKFQYVERTLNFIDDFILGEIRNKATGYADIGVIYGNTKEESLKIRTFFNGKIFLTKGRTIAVDANGQYTETSKRLTTVVTVGVWGVILTRNHNNLAERLAALNPSWNDEKAYQEARRINIAIIQNLMTSKDVIDDTFGQLVKKDYNPDIEGAETVEFRGAATFSHFLLPTNFKMINKLGQLTEIAQSDMVSRVDILDKYFDDSVRGALNHAMFVDQYSNEVS
jgi:Animal haem peroxidase